MCAVQSATDLLQGGIDKMANLIYYQQERSKFREQFDKKMTSEEFEIVFQKLKKHFKLYCSLDFTIGCRHSHASKNHVTINIAQQDFGTLCHELAHVLHLQKYEFQGRWHGKLHERLMKRMLNYCKKRNYFADELARRTAPKLARQEPTADEVKQKEIVHLESKIKRYASKVKMYQNKLKKTQRKFERLKV